MIKTKDKLTYGIGNVSNGIILQALTSYLVFFGTTILGLSGTIIGLVIAVSVVWDAVSDLLIGHMSDYAISKRFGRRHLFMIVGTIGLVIFNGLLWSIQPSWSYVLKVMLLFVCVMMVKTFMTILVTPYNALGAELSSDYHERTSIQAYRTVFFILGVAFTTVAGMVFYFKPTTLYPLGQLNPIAYQQLGISLSLIVLICAGIATVTTLKYIPFLPKNTKVEQKSSIKLMIMEFKVILENKNYLYVAGAYLSANIATAIVGAVGLHVYTYTFKINNYGIGILFGVMFGLSVLSQQFWVAYTKKRDKRTSALLAVKLSILSSIFFIALVLFRDYVIAHPIWMMAYVIPSGIGIGGLITLPFSMIADTVDEEELMTGHRSEGLYYGGLTFSYKISQSVAIFLLGIILDLVGFDSSLAVQPTATVVGLGLVVAFGTLVALLMAYRFYNRYNMTKDKAESIKKAIEAMATRQ